MSGILRKLIRLSHCSWCQTTFLWGKIPLPEQWNGTSKGEGYCCPKCSQALVRQISECHHDL